MNHARAPAQVSGIVTEAVKDKFGNNSPPKADDSDDGLATLDPKKMTLQQMRDAKLARGGSWLLCANV